KKTREIKAIRRAINENAGIAVNDFDEVLMDGRFLKYVLGEFNRYISELVASVSRYQSSIS
ncbi:TPA: hypothetical protein MIK07_21725, partial [Klebsiella pneumoniae]|nr:hypothetical protein [Klebsiella pneumoniae]HBX9320416.1 hypothetical protein [Klebsiella pneumoniae]HBX9337028.1 hypothetical protein [Klebsiella pneumoniae]HBX9344495.1 hypothetical protein [Klebsiella pneumoniae]HBX9361639.1 hypothetical protein [Klebsiella pneumoniae]